MPGWFAPKCPLDTWEKTWVETRMRWLADRFGLKPLLEAEVVLPTDDYFPDPYHGAPADARGMLDRLCLYMGVDPLRTELEIGRHVSSAHDGIFVIRVEPADFTDPQRLLATMARELAHELLIDGGFPPTDAHDEEAIADLVPVYLGVGIFAANVALAEACGFEGHLSWWTMAKHGCLPARVLGYAFALFAWMREETDPPWAAYLRPDAAAALTGGLRYLSQTDDSVFHPDTIRLPRRPAPPSEVVTRLESASASVRLATLWEIREHPSSDPDVVAAVTQCLADAERVIPGEAARTLAVLGPAARSAVPLLRSLLGNREDPTRAGAAYAIGVLDTEPDAVVPDLCALLADSNRQVVDAAAGALAYLGNRVEPAVGPVLAALEKALIDCDAALIEVLIGALVVVAAHPRQRFREHFTHGDPDLYRLARAALKEHVARSHDERPAGRPHGRSTWRVKDAMGGTSAI